MPQDGPTIGSAEWYADQLAKATKSNHSLMAEWRQVQQEVKARRIREEMMLKEIDQLKVDNANHTEVIREIREARELVKTTLQQRGITLHARETHELKGTFFLYTLLAITGTIEPDIDLLSQFIYELETRQEARIEEAGKREQALGHQLKSTQESLQTLQKIVAREERSPFVAPALMQAFLRLDDMAHELMSDLRGEEGELFEVI